MTTKEILTQAVTAKNAINSADTETKNKALANMADALLAHTDAILEANKQDVEAARGKISDVMIDRLMLDAGRIEGMAKGIRELIDLDDPAGKVLRTVERPNGIVIEKTAVPMGVIAIIYESRPNVTSDAAALCIKSGNVCVLRSGKEAWKSANAVVTALKEGMVKSNLPGEGIQLIEDTSRESSVELMMISLTFASKSFFGIPVDSNTNTGFASGFIFILLRYCLRKPSISSTRTFARGFMVNRILLPFCSMERSHA